MFDVLQTIPTLLVEPLQYFLSPNKRVYWLYLLSSALIATAVIHLRGEDLKAAAARVVSPQLWLNASTLLDLKWIGLNHVVRALLVIPVLGGQVAFALTVNRFLSGTIGEGNFLAWNAVLTGTLFTVVIFLCDDFSRFFVHFCYHRMAWLWRFHAIHHSATLLTPLTLYRIHFVEMAINSSRSLLVVGGISGVFIYLFDGSIGRIEVLGASVFSFLFNMAGANLRHSSIWLGFGRFERWFISPAQHQIHHSTAAHHVDKNYGSTLAIWDRWFNSWVASKDERVPTFGLVGKPVPQQLSKQLLGL